MSRTPFVSKSAQAAQGHAVAPYQQLQSEVVTHGSARAAARSDERVFDDNTSPRHDLRIDADERHESREYTGIASPPHSADSPPPPPRGFWDRFAGQA